MSFEAYEVALIVDWPGKQQMNAVFFLVTIYLQSSSTCIHFFELSVYSINIKINAWCCISYLVHLLIDPKIWKHLQQRFERSTNGSICDIYDGAAYQKYGEFLSKENPAHTSLLCNTDGVALFRSSKFSIWPIWLVINELPPSQR